MLFYNTVLRNAQTDNKDSIMYEAGSVGIDFSFQYHIPVSELLTVVQSQRCVNVTSTGNHIPDKCLFTVMGFLTSGLKICLKYGRCTKAVSSERLSALVHLRLVN